MVSSDSVCASGLKAEVRIRGARGGSALSCRFLGLTYTAVSSVFFEVRWVWEAPFLGWGEDDGSGPFTPALQYQIFLSKVKEAFQCICCQELVFRPVTTVCQHNVCKVRRWLEGGSIAGPPSVLSVSFIEIPEPHTLWDVARDYQEGAQRVLESQEEVLCGYYQLSPHPPHVSCRTAWTGPSGPRCSAAQPVAMSWTTAPQPG